MSTPPSPSRRAFLQILGSAAIAGVLGYAAGSSLAPRKTVTATTTVTQQAGAETVTTTVTKTPAAKLTAAWIYVGPIGDAGWTYAHNAGREHATSVFGDKLDAKYVESVPETGAKQVIQQMIEDQGAKVVFATSFGYYTAIQELAKKYPDVWFWHCSGPYEFFTDLPNVGTYFAELYQAYYLNGLIAGAVTQTGKVGYVPAFLIPEVVRHINAFALGARDGYRLVHGKDKDVTVYLAPELKAWFAPDKAEISARNLVDNYDVDVIAFTEDTYTIPSVAEDYQSKGRKVWSFSHYSDMSRFAPNAILTGQLVNWGPIYEYILARLYAGDPRKEDIWARIGDFMPIRWRKPAEQSTLGKVEGAVYLPPIKEEAVPAAAVKLARKLYEDMKELIFEPFSGYDPITGEPREIRDTDGEVRIPKGGRLGRHELWSDEEMNWFLDNIEKL